jgi:ubiquinone/menaquinone biosynthesis C-methylase UbiE
MKLVSKDDFIDIYLKTSQRGLAFMLKKLNLNAKSRTKSAFDDSAIQSSNWWIIPEVKERWNEKITGSRLLEYEEYTVNKYLKNERNLRMLSIGAGVCSHELKFAAYPNFKEIVCIDIADNLLKTAAERAKKKGLKNIKFLSEDIYKAAFEVNEFDMIMFHSSLHHFSNIQNLIETKIKKWLKSKGVLLINEYVGPNRLQFNKDQISNINIGLDIIPNELKQRFKSKLIKNKFYGSGYIRMIIADPSECIESANILPILRNEFEIIEEKAMGGNLLMNILKDISHNFVNSQDVKAKNILMKLFELEDEYLKTRDSDFLFGLYRNN